MANRPPEGLRLAAPEDIELLLQALAAEAWLEELLADEEYFVGNWGREGDGGLVADDGGAPRAAAWYRTFEAARPELGFIDAATPVLVNAWVAPDLRGGGHGTAMLEQLLGMCDANGYRAMSLSTEQHNPALRLYWRLGFETVAAIGNHWLLVNNGLARYRM